MKDAGKMLEKLDRQQASELLSPWPKWFILSAGGILALAGANNIQDFCSRSQVLNLQDPLLGIPSRYFLLLAGLIELFLALLCLFTNKQKLTLALVAWLVVNFVTYRGGLWAMGWYHPRVFVGELTNVLSISPLLADYIILAVSLYLLIGSGTALFFGKKNQAMLLPADQFESFEIIKSFCPFCGTNLEFPVESLGQKINCLRCKANITLRNPDEMMKMSCFFCKEHVDFPVHALGRKIECPHCKMEISLKEQNK